ncbi:MAG: class I fructose-bisphosphate aldolase [Anaerolineaceae bacterium]|jgi:fructose-bisphosphate aldolase class I|nr:class I fructose-bisphosphate aldolase [Anaerolineaceae bacterium]
MNKSELERTARSLVVKGKGILAADESLRSTERRFARYHVEHIPENRRLYRDMMFTTPGLEEYISGVILFDESIRQTAHDGSPFPEYLVKKGIIPGIKVDGGFVDLPGFPGEKITEGLDGLSARLAEYRGLGARFAKWRAVIAIGENIPSQFCMQANAHALARYAACCQAADIVPIVEPDVLIIGDHSIERCEEVSTEMLSTTFRELKKANVYLEGTLLKPNMVLPGKDAPRQASNAEVAEATLRTLKRTVPAAVPGVVFLSGGQGSVPAAANLNAMVRMGGGPWELSFSYLRALADPAFDVWRGNSESFDAAQKVFYHRARLTAAARKGEYQPSMEAMES